MAVIIGVKLPQASCQYAVCPSKKRAKSNTKKSERSQAAGRKNKRMLSSALESVRAPEAVGFCLAKKSVVRTWRVSSGLRRYDARMRFPVLLCEEQNNRKISGYAYR